MPAAHTGRFLFMPIIFHPMPDCVKSCDDEDRFIAGTKKERSAAPADLMKLRLSVTESGLCVSFRQL